MRAGLVVVRATRPAGPFAFAANLSAPRQAGNAAPSAAPEPKAKAEPKAKRGPGRPRKSGPAPQEASAAPASTGKRKAEDLFFTEEPVNRASIEAFMKHRGSRKVILESGYSLFETLGFFLVRAAASPARTGARSLAQQQTNRAIATLRIEPGWSDRQSRSHRSPKPRTATNKPSNRHSKNRAWLVGPPDPLAAEASSANTENEQSLKQSFKSRAWLGGTVPLPAEALRKHKKKEPRSSLTRPGLASARGGLGVLRIKHSQVAYMKSRTPTPPSAEHPEDPSRSHSWPGCAP